MVTFSVGGCDDGEGPSNPNQKRRRVDAGEEVIAATTTREEEEEENQQRQEGFEMENPPIGTLENDANEGNSVGSNAGQQNNDLSKKVSAIISDPDVLDCFICSEPLAVPIYQVSFLLGVLFCCDFCFSMNFGCYLICDGRFSLRSLKIELGFCCVGIWDHKKVVFSCSDLG